MSGMLIAVKETPPPMLYEEACLAVARAKTTDEVQTIGTRAEMMRAYARRAKNRQLEIDAAEIRMRATRRLGEIIALQKATVGLNVGGRPLKTGSNLDPVSSLSLDDVGIGKHLADDARKAAAVPEDEFEDILADWRARAEALDSRIVASFERAAGHHRTRFTGENEWYTPAQYVDAARTVLGGIDLDPATSAVAQAMIGAARYFTLDDDGLEQEWYGRVWLNPPYAQPAIAHFIDKLLAELDAGRTIEAILLTHNYTDTGWFHAAAGQCAAICFTRGRIKFVSATGEIAAPAQGQAFFYFGPQTERFRQVFDRYGFIR